MPEPTVCVVLKLPKRLFRRGTKNHKEALDRTFQKAWGKSNTAEKILATAVEDARAERT